MRVTFVFFAAIALSIVDAATNAGPTTISTRASMGLSQSVDALGNPNDKRLLRIHGEPEDDDSEDSSDEERGVSLTAEQIAHLINGRTRTIFSEWSNAGHSRETVKDAMKALFESKKLTEEQYKDVVRRYNDVA